MKIWKLNILVLLLILTIAFPFINVLGWIGSIVFGSLLIIALSLSYGGNFIDLKNLIISNLRKKSVSKIDDKQINSEDNINKNINSILTASIGTVALGLSGGVDSAVSAILLKEQGYDVHAFFMRNWSPSKANEVAELLRINDAKKKGDFIDAMCTSERDYEDAKKTAQQLNIKLTYVDFTDEYWEKVFSKFLEGIKMGITPNPDILCNSKIKFGVFFDYIRENYPEIDFISTGHYAKVIRKRGEYFLSRCLDESKDQTYFLAEIDKEILPWLKFPLENILKSDVRKIAKENNLFVADKKDSVGICFIGPKDFKKFLSNYIIPNPGDIVDYSTNKIIGKHDGVLYYTIGQRKGINLSGMSEPHFVSAKDINKNILYVSPSSEEDIHLCSSFVSVNTNILVPNLSYLSTNISIKIRHSPELYKAKIISIIERENSTFEIEFKSEPIKFITPGQEVVMYKGKICLGGGEISRYIPLDAN